MAKADDASVAAAWTRCAECDQSIERADLARRLLVCPQCGYHFRMGADHRLAMLLDRGSFSEHDSTLASRDVLSFPEKPSYEERLAAAAEHTGHNEAVLTGTGALDGILIGIAVFDFRFMGGSMGTTVGEKLTRLIEHALAERIPLVIVSASGGARMQEGMYSLVQMAKLTGALGRLRAAGVPYISVLTDPTTGGVAASVALLGDVNIAEPRALIGFAGPRVIARTINEQLPEGFQRAEFLLAHGMVDRVIERAALRQTLARLLRLLAPGAARKPATRRPRPRAATAARRRPRA